MCYNARFDLYGRYWTRWTTMTFWKNAETFENSTRRFFCFWVSVIYDLMELVEYSGKIHGFENVIFSLVIYAFFETRLLWNFVGNHPLKYFTHPEMCTSCPNIQSSHYRDRRHWNWISSGNFCSSSLRARIV